MRVEVKGFVSVLYPLKVVYPLLSQTVGKLFVFIFLSNLLRRSTKTLIKIQQRVTNKHVNYYVSIEDVTTLKRYFFPQF